VSPDDIEFRAMSKEVLINAGAAEIRVAIVENGRLHEIFLERLIGTDDGSLRRRGGERSGHSLIGNIILGRVQRVLPGMQAAFVDIGNERAGFLGAKEARCLADLPGFEDERAPKIGDCVREGEEIVVQVVKDPIGEKGARLSANVTIPGRLLVLVPNQSGVALSRRITDETERARLVSLCENMIAEAGGALVQGAGYIVRSAAIGASLADVREDAERLAETWLPVMARRKAARVPSTLYHHAR
jgi:ribonuclease G